ncbi:MAG: ABC transporter substrate-binding protein [Eubacteriales bacterium]|nr:ABC transporter substrate-binding protein [Eubacteriales bacterium]
MKRKLLSIVLAATMIATALVGCGSSGSGNASGSASPEAASAEATAELPSAPTDQGEPVYGGTLNLYYTSDIDAYFDPAIGDTVCYNLFLEGLWSYDETSGFAAASDNIPASSLQGQLAASWEADEEAKTLTVTLRDDVYFQKLDDAYDYYGGRQLVANDVKWSYDRLCGTGSGYDEPMETESNWAGNLNMLESVEAPDDTTVIFHLTSADEVTVANFMQQFVKIGGPEWDTLTDEQKADFHYACGTGPYMLTGFEAGQKVELTKNEDYYDTDERYPENKLPYLDGITFTYIADSTNIVTQFTSGGIDVFGSNRANLVNDSEAQQIASAMADYYVVPLSSANPEYLAMKCNQEPFNDIRVREAMQHAINMQEIHTEFLQLGGEPELSGLWNPTTSEWSTVDTWDQEVVDSYAYDPEKAKALLEEAGYADGFEFTVVISADNNADLWVLAQEYWNAIGVTMNIETVDNFMEAKTIGTDSADARNTGSSGCGAVSSIQAAINQTVDGGWASSLWNEDAEYNAMLESMGTATTLEDQAEYAKDADLHYAQQHWTVNLTGMRVLNFYYNNRVAGIPEGCSMYSGKAANTLISHTWVTDGQ